MTATTTPSAPSTKSAVEIADFWTDAVALQQFVANNICQWFDEGWVKGFLSGKDVESEPLLGNLIIIRLLVGHEPFRGTKFGEEFDVEELLKEIPDIQMRQRLRALTHLKPALLAQVVLLNK